MIMATLYKGKIVIDTGLLFQRFSLYHRGGEHGGTQARQDFYIQVGRQQEERMALGLA